MKKIIGTLSVFTAFILILSSCSKVDKNAMLIPRDAAFAVHLNTNSLSGKLSWAEIKQTKWFQDMHKASAEDSLTQKLLDDPDNSGMKTNDGFTMFAKRANSQKGYFGFAGSIKDAAAFEAFNKKVSRNAETTNANNLKSIRFEGNKGVVTWNSDRFLYLMDVPFGNLTSRLPPGMQDDSLQDYQEPAPLDLHAIARNIFAYKNDSLLVSDDRFSSLLKEKGDVHFWFNAETAYGTGTSLGFMSMLKMDVYFKEAVTAATLNFDNGKITVHSRSYNNREMRELFKRYGGTNINQDLIKRLPTDNVLGVLAMNYKPEGLKEFLKLGGLDGMLNTFLAEMQITMEDFIAANKGEMLLAVTDVTMKEKAFSLGEGMDSVRTMAPDFNILFVNAVANRAAFDKLVAAGKKMTEREGTPPGIFYSISNDLFVLGNKQETVDAYVKGGSRDFSFLSRINGHPVGFYLDLNKMISAFSQNVKDSTGRYAADVSLQTWKDVVATGGEYKDEAVHQDFEITLVDPNTNSLKQLNAYAEKLASMKKRGF